MQPRALLPLHALALAAALLAPACKPAQEDPCIPPDPAATASLSIDFGSWPIIDSEQPRIEVAADCTVQTATNAAGKVDVALLCSEGAQVDVAISIAVTAPADFEIDLSDGQQVRLDAYWQDVGHHTDTGEWFVIRAAGDDAVLLAGLDNDSHDGLDEALGALSITPVEGVCESPCGDTCTESDAVERLAFAFAHSDGTSLDLLDQTRGDLLAGGRRHDIVLAQAHKFFCLNCWDEYRWILGSVPG